MIRSTETQDYAGGSLETVINCHRGSEVLVRGQIIRARYYYYHHHYHGNHGYLSQPKNLQQHFLSLYRLPFYSTALGPQNYPFLLYKSLFLSPMLSRLLNSRKTTLGPRGDLRPIANLQSKSSI